MGEIIQFPRKHIEAPKLWTPDQQLMRVGGVFHIEHFRDGKLIDAWDEPNMVVNEGLNSMLGINFHADAQITAWYVSLFKGNYTPVATETAATVTASSTEITTADVTNTARPAYTVAAAASQQVTNSASVAVFTANATNTIYGAFLASASAFGATTGVLFAISRFATARNVVANDQLNVTYTIQASSA